MTRVEAKEETSQTISIKPATFVDWTQIKQFYEEGLGTVDEQLSHSIRSILVDSEREAVNGKKLLSFIAYVDGKPAGSVLLTRISDQDVDQRVRRYLAKQDDHLPPNHALISSFIIAKEFQRNPEVLWKMATHLLTIKEHGRPFVFHAKAEEGTMFRIAKSPAIQKRLRESVGYVVDDLSHISGLSDGETHRIALRPIRKNGNRLMTFVRRIAQGLR